MFNKIYFARAELVDSQGKIVRCLWKLFKLKFRACPVQAIIKWTDAIDKEYPELDFKMTEFRRV